MAVLLLAVPGNTNLGGLYVFERTIWHLVGLFIGMLIERLFWFRSATQRLQDSEQLLVKQLQSCLLKAEAVSSDDLILSYAKHCKIKSIAYRDCKIDDLKFVSLNEREELLEIAFRHAVALGRGLCHWGGRTASVPAAGWHAPATEHRQFSRRRIHGPAPADQTAARRNICRYRQGRRRP